MDRVRLSKPVVLLFIATLVLAIVTVVVVQVLAHSQPDVQSQFTLYMEKLEPQSMVVAATTQERYEASKEFTAKLLAIFNIKAKIRLSAMADITYVIPASDPSAWSIQWDARARKLVISTPAPDCLLPAVHTDTIEIVTENSNLLTNTMFRLKEEAARMQDELSNDLLVRAKATLEEPAVRAVIEDGVRRFAGTFCESAHLGKPALIEVQLGRLQKTGQNQ
ncbi:exported hypothetical protein [uncultured spirochete]|uniref:DUF4230 domain-containing protein n=1 Tax=uncultured spirochete TaxID=156406 RepID=A0A3P3XQB5_9SPIR|nr:exported hypothetical protein [uncultured spirochete]